MNKTPIILLILIMLMVQIASATLLDNLIAAYKMDESSGTNVYNSANASLNATAVGTAIIAGIDGYGRNFTGSASNYVYTNLALSDTGQYTVSMWVHNKKAPPGNNEYTGFFTTKSVAGWRLETDGTTGTSAMYHWGLAGTAATDSNLTVNDIDDGLVNIVIQFNYSSAFLYKNGVLIASQAYTKAASYITNITIGYAYQNGYGNAACSPDCNRMFNGTIDEVYIWNRFLNSSEISQVANGTTTASFYPFVVYPNITASSYNFTSGYNYADQIYWRTNKSYRAITEDFTPTIYFWTTVTDTCAISTCDYNFTNRASCSNWANCSESASTTHTCTIPTNLTTSSNSLHLSCLGQIAGATSLSGSLNITLLGITTGGTGTLPSCLSIRNGCTVDYQPGCTFIQ